VRVVRLECGALRRAVLCGSRGNVLDRAAVEALDAVAREAGEDARVRAVILEGEGAHFSYGASVAEHLPGEVAEMLSRFHRLFETILQSGVVWLAAVRGRCLGGGLELAAFCHRVFAAPDATLGQPEIALGVFAPLASAWLPERVGRAAAEDLCLTGRSVGAAEALAMGLVDAVADDPSAAAEAWARAHLLPRSASSLRHAARALRADVETRLPARLRDLEARYLGGLMASEDALEGLRAFLEKRAPAWRDR
jgi:cyclohexa-1,5-dienecarbonyl-CoA hydratase